MLTINLLLSFFYLAPPVFTNDIPIKESYNIKEHKDLDLYFTIEGNPTPYITAVIGGITLQVVSSQLKEHTNKYSVLLKNLTRASCGEDLKIEAISQGYNKISTVAKINVSCMYP